MFCDSAGTAFTGSVGGPADVVSVLPLRQGRIWQDCGNILPFMQVKTERQESCASRREAVSEESTAGDLLGCRTFRENQAF